jgi:hypothetical protein
VLEQLILAKQIFFTRSIIKAFSILYLSQQKMAGQKKYTPSSFGAVVGSGIRNG